MIRVIYIIVGLGIVSVLLVCWVRDIVEWFYEVWFVDVVVSEGVIIKRWWRGVIVFVGVVLIIAVLWVKVVIFGVCVIR